ncbi:MAG: PD-(D/E)XK nuclease family protein [Burkholderiales bacterium]|nr:PD-(D/E)XK nuclease family protein [Bacteroidia bacterium]
MIPFLQYIAQYIFQHHEHDTEHLCIVLPNKRGALYLKQHLAKTFQKTIWLPTIISAEELVAELSGLQQADSIDLICDLYEVYAGVLKEKAEPFEAFAKWGTLMLQDFNEADRYLVDTNSMYQNLKEIKEIESWSLNADSLTNTQQDYVNFMFQMGTIYHEFVKTLIEKKQAYQGLMYRKAVESYKDSVYISQFSKILICGFNALNKVETIIFSDLVKEKKAHIIYDADTYYLNNESYEAGLFLRKNFNNAWLDTKDHIGDYFNEIPKHIDVVAVPKQMGQAQVVSHQLSEWIRQGKSLNKTAVILADESLLFPVLNQIPKEVQHVNITMEYPLRLSPIYDLIDNLISLHQSRQKPGAGSSFYFADLFRIFQNSLFKKYYRSFKPTITLQSIIQKVIDKNYVWINAKVLAELFEDNYQFIQDLFTTWNNSAQGISSMYEIIRVFNTSEEEELQLSSADKETLHVFTKYFNRLQSLIQTHRYLDSLITLKSLYKQIIGAASVPFIGEPLQGLQIMGVLETRTLDFENIIFLGVNEGVLPSGKSSNSFIPNDLKRYHGMPLYADKDAVYAYHFYRILQRASNVLITYNTEQSVLGSGEKSRFITQLQFELHRYNSAHVITEKMLSGDTLPASSRNVITISKTETNLAPIIYKLTTDGQYGGLSPSALITYKDCALRFFFRYGAGIKETEDVEESAEANTQGTILHESLELLYKPFIGQVLTEGSIKTCLDKTEESVNLIFQNYFSQRESQFGKNFLQQKVLYEYVRKLLRNDLKLIQDSKKTNELLSLIDLEKNLSASVSLQIKGVETTVYVKGSADRIDKLGNKIRIIDYKSSLKADDKFKFTNFDDLFNDSQYNKMLQLFMYAWLVVKNNLAKPEELQPCIIAFKKFEEHPKFIMDEGRGGGIMVFTAELLQEFEEHFILKISEILSRDSSFIQTDDLDKCEYCAYAGICNVR